MLISNIYYSFIKQSHTLFCLDNMKEIILDVLSYLHAQVEQGRYTTDSLESLYRVLVDADIDTTIDNIASYYGQSRSNVRNLLSRRYIGKPKRRVYYNYKQVRGIIPNRWNNSISNNRLSLKR